VCAAKRGGQGIPFDRVVRREDGFPPPFDGLMVFGRFEERDDGCAEVGRFYDDWIARAVIPPEG
jgi:hypothetical protein